MVPESAPPTCPACQGALVKHPKAKTKCRHCGAFIYVRSRPIGGRWLLAEAELAGVEAEWAREREAPSQRPEHLWTEVHVVGESHRNPDGTSRQQLIRTRVHVGDAVQLLPEPDNEYDPNAVKVCLVTGEQLGYLSSSDAEDLTEERCHRWRHEAVIHRVLGGTPDKPSVGVLLRLVSAPPDTTEADVAAAVESARSAPDAWERAREPGLKPTPPSREPRAAITLEVSAAPSEASGSEDDGARRPRWPWVIIAAMVATVLYLLAR